MYLDKFGITEVPGIRPYVAPAKCVREDERLKSALNGRRLATTVISALWLRAKC